MRCIFAIAEPNSQLIWTAVIRYDPVSQQVIESRLQKYVGNDKQREDTLRQMFSQAGCDD